MKQTATEQWDRRSCTASAFNSLIDPEDWIMAFMELSHGPDFTYGFKLGNLEQRITYWSYHQDDKKRVVSNELDNLRSPLKSLFNTHTLERMRGNFLHAAENAIRQIKNMSPTAGASSVQELAEAICNRDGLSPEYAGDFCKAVLLQLPSLNDESAYDPAATRFFDYLSYLSRSIYYSIKDREAIHTLDYDGFIQGIFEATHSMCLAQGIFLMSQNFLFSNVEQVFTFPKGEVESLETLKEIRSFYRKNWQGIENLLKEELEAKDYKRLQSWIRDCLQHIEQAWKHREAVTLWNICGPCQFVFADAANPSYQHASIALFAEVLKNELDFQPPIPRNTFRERANHMSTLLSKPQAEISKPDLIADRIVPLLGNDGWVWLQALYETWALHRLRNDYPFKQGLNTAEKVSLMRRIKKYWIKNVSLFLLKTHPQRSKADKERLLEQCKMVALQLENAHEHQDSSTINEIVEPFSKTDNWFCQDLFMHILNNPLSFFDFKQIAPDADDSEKPFGRHFTLHSFLRAVEKVGQYMHYNSKGIPEEYDLFISWLEKHAETFVNASSLLEWEMQDKYQPITDKPFPQWLDTTISQLESAINQTQATTCIRDYLAAWMDPNFPHPQLDDFSKLTITRESLSCLDDFALEHFNKPVNEMAYWDILRRPSLYLLADLFQEGFFLKLDSRSRQPSDFQADNVIETDAQRLEQLPYEQERQGLARQLFTLFTSLHQPQTIDQLKTILWPDDEPDTHIDKDVQDKISVLKGKLKTLNSEWCIPNKTLKNPTRYQVVRKPS